MAPIYFSRLVRESPFHGGTRRIITRVIITGIAVFLAVGTVPGIEADTLSSGIAAVLVLTILNLVLRPVLFVLTLPLIVFSLGLFLVVLNALLLELTAYLVKGFAVSGFWPAAGGALIISVVTTILNSWLIDRPIDQVDHERRPPRIINPQ